MNIPAAVVGVSPTFSQPPVTDYDVWFDFNDFTTFSGRGASGGVGIVLDKAFGSQGYIVQATGTARAGYGSRRIGQHLALDFDAGDSYGSSESTVPVRPMTIMVVAELDNATGTNRFVVAGSGGNNRIGLYAAQTTAELGINFANIANALSGVTITTGVPHVLGAALGASNIKFIFDGATNDVANSTASTAGLVLVGTFTGGANLWDGSIGEILIWDRELSVDEITSVNDYLSAKWGI